MSGAMRGWKAALTVGLIALASPAFSGTWTFEDGGHFQLRYLDGKRATFSLGCGRIFGLAVKYPGKPGKQGDPASITLASGTSSMTFDGYYYPSNSKDDATTFMQQDLGFQRADAELYGERWKTLRNHLLDLLDSGQPLKVTAGKNSYQLPPNDAHDWRERFENCN